MDIINPNYLNYMEQIQKNRKDIKELFERGLFNYKGEWNSNTTYSKNDCVKYNNSLYIYKLEESSVGILPTNNIYWDLFQQDTGTLVQDTNGNSLSTCRFSGHNGINVDMDENNPNEFNFRLDQDITNKLAKTLTTPVSAPVETQLVGIGTNNSQILIPESQLTEKNIITGYTIADYQPSALNVYEKVPFVEYHKEGNKLNLIDGSVIVGSGISFVLVSFTTTIYIAELTYERIGIMKNGQIVKFQYLQNKDSVNRSINLAISPVLIPVDEGDEISIYYQHTGISELLSIDKSTTFTVEGV